MTTFLSAATLGRGGVTDKSRQLGGAREPRRCLVHRAAGSLLRGDDGLLDCLDRARDVPLPDGSGKDWDNEQFPEVELKGFNLVFGQSDDDATEDEGEPPKRITEAATVPDTFRSDAVARLSQIQTRLGWIIALVVVVAALVATR